MFCLMMCLGLSSCKSPYSLMRICAAHTQPRAAIPTVVQYLNLWD